MCCKIIILENKQNLHDILQHSKDQVFHLQMLFGQMQAQPPPHRAVNTNRGRREML